MVVPKYRNAPQLQECSTATGMLHSYRNVSMFYEYFIGQGMFFKLNKIPLIWARLQECYFKMLTLLHKIHEVNKKNMVVFRDRCCQAHPRAATPVRPWIHPQG